MGNGVHVENSGPAFPSERVTLECGSVGVPRGPHRAPIWRTGAPVMGSEHTAACWLVWEKMK